MSSPAEASMPENTKDSELGNPEYEVIIVGAGMAGLSAAYRILTQRPDTKLLIIESRERVGGRIWSIPFDTKKFGLDGILAGGRSIDLGASFIHGVRGNPLIALAKEIDLPVKRAADAGDPASGMRAFTSDGKQVPIELATEMSGRVFGTMFGWLPALAQGDDGGKEVIADEVSVKDGVLLEGSPIYGGKEKTSNESSTGTGDKAKAEGSLKKVEDDKLRIALSLARSFQGWTGAPIDYVSLRWWGFNQDLEGGDGILVRGYGEMVNWLKREIEWMGGLIRLEEKLTSVELVEDEEGDGGVVLTTRTSSEKKSFSQDQRYEAPYTLLTLPLGVLKYSPPEFTPPISIRRQRAIDRLGMGLLDKVILIYEDAWWAGTSPGAMNNILIPSKDDPTRLLGPTRGLPPKSNADQQGYTLGGLKGSFPVRTPRYLEENPQTLMVFDLHEQCGIPALCVFVSGEFGDVMELCEESVTTEWVTDVVEQWLGGLKNDGGDIPKPVEVFRTAWRKDENAYGSYAYIPVGGFHDGVNVEAATVEDRGEAKENSFGKIDAAASPLDQLELSRTMWGRCFWAGEHTEYNQYASVHAAWTSGAREADKILACLNGVDI